jgi:predicted RNA-binding protein YlxR (DUF448 family)
MPIRSCVGCRQRWPITQLLGLVRKDETFALVRLAGTPVRRAAGEGRRFPGPVAIDGRMLVNGEDVAEGVREGVLPPGKGWSVCPSAKCLERALRAKAAEARSRAAKALAATAGAGSAVEGDAGHGRGADRRSSKKEHRARAAGNPGVGDDVTQVLDEATLLVARWIEQRHEGLRRRRVPVTGDARLDAWKKLADRMLAERAGR